MNKFTILFLTLFLALPMAMKADSAKEKKDSRNESGTNLRHNDKVDGRTSERK